jgi:phage terminase large subunit
MINWVDNPWFKELPLYDDMLADYAADPDKAEHVWGGAYGSSQGAILARWVNEAERDGRITDSVTTDKQGAGLIVSCDLGFRDTAGFWYWQPVLGGGNVVRYDADHGLDADDWIPRIQQNINELGATLGKIWLPHDARHKTFQSKHTSQQRFQAAFGMGKVGIVPMARKGDQIEAARTFIKQCAFNKSECEAGLDGLRAWEFEYNEDDGIFSKEPKHNWASHPGDAFAYGCQVLKEHQPTTEEKFQPKFWDQQSLNELWESTPKKFKRV